jgi:membrane protease subunit HflC
MNRVFIPVVVLGLLVLIILSGAFYTVGEREQVIITQFGEPISGAITTPGLHVKVPFIQTVRSFDKRVLEWDGATEQIPTLDKRFILLDTIARWRIVDPLRFLQSVGNERSAQSRLDDLIESASRDIVSGHLLIQAVRNFQRELSPELLSDRAAGAVQEAGAEIKPQIDEQSPTFEEIAPEDRLGRDKLTDLMVKRAQENLPNLGIKLIDVRIKRINYVSEVEQKVFERMISERQRIASRFRSEGDGASAKIRGDKERELDQISSEAYRRAQEIIGKADAEAARIYAEAYGQDAEFYSFVETLKTYRETLKQNSSLLLTTESDFYRYLKNATTDGDGASPPYSLSH